MKFFRKLRQTLLSEGKIGKYLKYAIGEIVLVVIGILIALQINNWNQKKQADKEFKTAIEQIYTHLHAAKEVDTWDISVVEEQLELCKAMQSNIDSFSNFEILRNAHFLDWMSGTGTRLLNFDDFLNKIEFDPNDKAKSSLVFHLNQFFILLLDALDHDFMNFKEKYFEPIFKRNHMPISTGQVRTSIKMAKEGEYTILSEYAIDKIDSLKHSNEFESALKSTEHRIKRILWALKFRKAESEAVREMLLRYDNNLELKYDGIIIDGTAINGENSQPMNLTNANEGIWTAEMRLIDGTIKFKSTYAHYFSWGGSDGELRELKFWGEPIEVTSGEYYITVNLEKMEYKIEQK